MPGIMAKRTTTTTGAAKRARKTAPRKTTRRASAKPVTAAASKEETVAVESTGIASPFEPTSEQIAERAYFLSLVRTGPGGPLDDWLQAESELRNGSIPV